MFAAARSPAHMIRRSAPTRWFSSSIASTFPRITRRLPSSRLTPETASGDPSDPLSFSSIIDTPRAPYAWFIPKSSSSAPVTRPSFLPPPPRIAFPETKEVPPPPPDLPETLVDMYNYLWKMPLLIDSGPTFIETSRPAKQSIPIIDHPPTNGKRKRGPRDGGPGLGALNVGGWWSWVVVCEVEGKGVGSVRRSELAIREWLATNPITLQGTSNVPTKTPRPSKNEASSEWALIDTGVGVVIHVMTANARAQWGVEGVWANVN
ncbi:Oligomerisation domain [Phaffia rhodozyma]|uniref:Oligomerisation domain n=1 Tax=Phaffia rhodozyma TaxID=264483 RepID=A0A0F7STZ1_PHARH|nr:Oligomerisation domain [Phaffia rhodozyma]